jgi:mRNA-degrading endonuclease toxin of MazEF toxin-antitoxin module
MVNEDQRFPMLCVVPLTATPGEGALYPQLRPGDSGLRKTSFALVDQLRAVDKRRVFQTHGVISADGMAAIDEGICLFLGLNILPEAK